MGEVGIRIQEAETEGEILTGGFRKGKNNDKDAGLYKKASFFHRTRHKFSIPSAQSILTVLLLAEQNTCTVFSFGLSASSNSPWIPYLMSVAPG